MNDQESYDALRLEYRYATTAVDKLAAERDAARADLARVTAERGEVSDQATDTKRIRPTPGPWLKLKWNDEYVVVGNRRTVASRVMIIDDAVLIADAGNTSHATGRLPSELAADLADVRAIFPAILDALHSGGCTPDASVEFLRQIPGEIRMVAHKQRRDLDRAIAERNAALQALRFIAQWGGHSAGGVDATGAWCAEQARSAICANAAGQTPAANKEDSHE